MLLAPLPSEEFITLLINKRYLLKSALVSMLLQLILFKLFYPYADYFSDSYSYIHAAITHQSANIWPIGYSKFLSIFHQFTSSDTALVSFQYMFLQLVALFFFYSILFLFCPSSFITKVVFCFLFFNPLHLYICNYVSSDALFLSLSLLWLTILLWCIYKPFPYLIIINAFIILIAFSVRYNAIYYPIISILAFSFSRYKLAYRIAGVLLPILLIYAFIVYTEQKTYLLTGKKQFSVFGGWQLANNALYMYPFIDVQEPVPTACHEFHNVVKKYFNNLPEELKNVSPVDGAFYIKFSHGPLKTYLVTHANFDTDSTRGFQAWGNVAPVYREYGSFLIRQHPLAFARYFLVPNSFNYLLPPLEKLEVYNLGMEKVDPIAKYWFRYPHSKVKVSSFTIQGVILTFFPNFFLILNLFFAGSIVWWAFLKRNIKLTNHITTSILLISVLLLVNGIFSVLASPIVFRYQVFPMIILFTFSLILIEQIQRLSKE